MKSVKIITKTNPNRDKLIYSGPLKFKASCQNCQVARNRHCQRCKACPGWHKHGCLEGVDAGVWH